MACRAYQTHPRDSHLTFAVVWDPETGLQSYSGCDLRRLRPISEEYDFPQSISSGSPLDDEGVIFCDTDDPISVSSRLRTRFIDPHAPCVCGRYTFGRGESISQTSSMSSSATTSSFSLSQTPTSSNPPSTSARPSSRWTFAALWDPKTGLSAFSQGKLAKFIPSTKHRKWPLSSPSGSSPSTEHHSYEYIENVKQGFYLRILPELGSHNTASSSPIEGDKYEPHFSCFDPLDEWFEPHLRPFPQSASGPAKIGNHLLGVAPMNDEYVMVGDDLSYTGDPYLPSRFSTSTSGYVPISPTSGHVIPPITFLGRRSSVPGSLRKRGKLLRSKPAGLRHETEAWMAIPRLFKNAPWLKGSEDGKWVFVEVQSVVTDRVIDER